MFARELMEKRPRLGSSKRKLLLGLAGSTCLLVAACAGTASLAGVGGDVAVAARSAPVAAPVAETIPAPEAAATPAIPVPEVRPPAVAAAPAEPAAVEPKAELKILPPEAHRHVEQNWESESFRNVASQSNSEPGRPAAPLSEGQRPPRDDRRGDRPYFRSERDRRGDRPFDSREPRGNFNPQSQAASQNRPAAEASPTASPAEPKKSGGLFAWVKNLFGSSPAETPKPEAQPEVQGQRDFSQEGPYRRRRRRGGRNHNYQGDQRGPRDGQQGGQPSGDQPGYSSDQRGYSGDQRGYGGDQRGYGGDQRHHGGRRHRHRGGGGGFRGNGRPEGGPPPSGS